MEIIVKAKIGQDLKVVSGLVSDRAQINGAYFNLNDPFDQKSAIKTMATLTRFQIWGKGRFADASADELMRQRFFDGAVRQYELALPSMGTVNGDFQITSLEFAGEDNGNVIYQIELMSCAAPDFTPVTPDQH